MTITCINDNSSQPTYDELTAKIAKLKAQFQDYKGLLQAIRARRREDTARAKEDCADLTHMIERIDW